MVYMLTKFYHVLEHAPCESHIGDFKLSATPAQFCKGCVYLTPVLEEAYSYDYGETPNYNKLNFLLKKILLDDLFTAPIPNF